MVGTQLARVAGASEQAEVCAKKRHENAALIPRVDTIDRASALSSDEPLRRAIAGVPRNATSVVECRFMKMARNGCPPSRYANIASIKRYCDRMMRWLRVCCLDVRDATSRAFKRVKIGKVAKARRYSSEPHALSTARAKRRIWRAFIGVIIAHGQSGP